VILRGLREGQSLTAAEAADAIRGSESKISRIENGRSGTRQRDLTDLLNFYRVDEDDQLRARLAELARETREPGWWRQSYGEAVPDWFEDYLGLEGEASSISTYQSALVEGLLQTPAYAEALRHRYLWHEFGDTCLLLHPAGAGAVAGAGTVAAA